MLFRSAVPKRTGRTSEDVLDDLADATVEWMRQQLGTTPQPA